MNIHEHQAKQILKKFGAIVPDGVFAFNVEELLKKSKLLKNDLKIFALSIFLTKKCNIELNYNNR